MKSTNLVIKDNAHVIMHGRNPDKTKKAVDEVKTKAKSEKISMILADLSSFKQIRHMSDQIHKKYDKIDVIINNAGVQMHTHEISEDGYEMTFAVNQLAYFLGTSLLLDLVQNSDYKRIILVASQLHAEELDFDNLQAEKAFSLIPIYAQSKLCNLLFGYRLARQLRDKGIKVNVVHPGLIDTNLNPKRSPQVIARALPVEQGSISTIYAATSPELKGVTGKYFLQDASEGKSRPISYDIEVQTKLWQVCEELIAEPFKF